MGVRRAHGILSLGVALLCSFSPTASSLSTENWMGDLSSIIGDLTVLDLSLPGTHDTLTATLSTDISQNTNDLNPWLSWVLHAFGNTSDIEPFVRNQSMTQGLTLTEQLNAGVRFIDFRITWSVGPSSWFGHPTFYGLHMMQTKQSAMTYLKEARAWLDAHPGEIVVFWVSRHGGACTTTFPGTRDYDTQQWWAELESVFDGLMFDERVDTLNSSSYGSLLQRGHRALFFLSAPSSATFSGNSPHAYDGCQYVDNQLGIGLNQADAALAKFRAAPAVRARDKAANRFYLQSMAPGAAGQQMKYSALLHFAPFLGEEKMVAECAASLGVPGLTAWCPMHLQDIAQLANYYNQRAFQQAAAAAVVNGSSSEEYAMPNGIYLNAVDLGGVFRTGSQLFGPVYGPTAGATVGDHATAGYSYTWTMALFTARTACATASSTAAAGGSGSGSKAAQCAQLLAAIQEQRAKAPLQQWNDAARGRFMP